MTRQILKGILVGIALFLFIFISLILHLILCFVPSLRWRYFSRFIFLFALSLRKILGVEIELKKSPQKISGRGQIIVCNHFSYLDGIILGSLFPVVYLSKKQIKQWPLVGIMSSVSGTIFIDRSRKNKAPEYVKKIIEKVKQGVDVLLFPEGTSTNGEAIRPFQSVFFAAALEANCNLLPVSIYYQKINGQEVNLENRDRLHWYGQVPFGDHVKELLKLSSIKAVVRVHSEFDTKGFDNSSSGRKELAEVARNIIVNGLPSNYLSK